MAVLVYIESENNQFKKSSYEALCYGKALGDNIAVSYTHLTLPTKA